MPRLRTLKPRIATHGSTASSGWKPDSVRGNRHQRGYGAEWERKREQIRERAHDLCEPHLREGLVHLGCICDHIVPKYQGGTDDDSNLQWVCKPYSDAKTQGEALEARQP